MKLSDFDYHLPKELIAQYPMKPRDRSRLLVLDGKSGRSEHKHFYDLIDYFQPGDVLVFNNSRVMRARLIGRKKTGGKIEVFLLKKIGRLGIDSDNRKLKEIKSAIGNRQSAIEIWQCLIGGKGRKENLEVEFSKGLKCKIIKNNGDGTWQVEFNKSGKTFMKLVEKIGQVPLPPYIKRTSASSGDDSAYQTVYAKYAGSVAAPTAGLHFTPALLKKLKAKGVQLEYATLHVGLGTFAPVKVDDVKKHKMHSEWVEVSKNTLNAILKAKSEGRRIIAVGTTSVRILESIFSRNKIENWQLKIGNFQGWVNIFIIPGYRFKAVDAMITNFHLPKSTLIMLVAAFLENKAGKGKGLKLAKKTYNKAIEKKYRFFSYGDAMLIL
ncbi:MAG: tRNA preQ1(34) S-adenosylmethionine ribosyltransferase-isomerase QueA [Patescibacteria group bacterium]|jgi:S-adenosylmethionine:tRNA ribosyltransferase-isomerase